MNAADGKIAAEFIRLSREALSERDRSRLIEVLLQRGKLVRDAQASGSGLGLPLHELEECLQREADLLSRLERERKNLLKQMEELSKSKSALRKYCSRFPFPPMPVFFDTTT